MRPLLARYTRSLSDTIFSRAIHWTLGTTEEETAVPS